MKSLVQDHLPKVKEQDLTCLAQSSWFSQHASLSGRFHGVIKNYRLLEKFSVLTVEKGGDTWQSSGEWASQAEGACLFAPSAPNGTAP